MKRLFVGIVILSFALQAFILFQGVGLWWDEAVYIGLSNSIWQGYYSLDPSLTLESFRPPLFPALLSLIPTGLESVFALVVSALSMVAAFALARPFGKREAILTAVFVSTSSLFVLTSTKLLTEPLFIIFLSLSLLSFLRWEKTGGNKNIFLAGAFAGLCFLTRYLASVLVISYVIFFVALLLRKELGRGVALFFVGFIVLISPWLGLNQLVYGDPVAGYFVNMGVYAASATQGLLEGFWGLLNAWGFLVIFLATFFYFFRRDLLSKGMMIFTIMFFVSVILYLAAPHKEPRYLLSFLPVYSLMAALGVGRLAASSRVVFPAVAVLSVATLFFGVQVAIQDVQADALVQASLFLKEVSSPSDLILTQSYPFAYALAERKGIPYCGFESQQKFDSCQAQILNGPFPLETLEATLEGFPVKYVLSSKHEPANPEEARDWLGDRFTKLKSFEQWGDPEAVVVYEV